MAASEDDLRAALEQGFKGDGSGACIAAAVIENGTTVQADFCAHAKSERSLDERTAFEIGSITKTMTAALLAEITGLGEIAIEFDAALQPRRKIDGTYTFAWHAFGGRQQAERVGATLHVAVRPAPTEAQLKGYEGNYSYSPTLGLRVYASGPKLMAQGRGRAPPEAAPFNQDIFVIEPIGAEVAFERNAGAKVIALTDSQRGQVLRSERH